MTLRQELTERGENHRVWLYASEQRAINAFWHACGETESFPRNLERYVALALPLTIIRLPRLRITDVRKWLAHRGARIQLQCNDRELRGCLVAHAGEGLIFADGTDCPQELRFTIAHEIAHFLVDYLQPRAVALDTFGSSMREVVDGIRVPTAPERLQALFAARAIHVHINLMERDTQGDTSSYVLTTENRADRVGLALLAPPEIVLSGLTPTAHSFAERHEAVTSELSHRYGLPVWLARTYGRALLDELGRGPSWVEAIRKS